jgi:hypothetical protein
MLCCLDLLITLAIVLITLLISFHNQFLLSLNLDIETLNKHLKENENMYTICNNSQNISTQNLTISSQYPSVLNSSIYNYRFTPIKEIDKSKQFSEGFCLISFVQRKFNYSSFSFSKLFRLINNRIEGFLKDYSNKRVLNIFTRKFSIFIKEIKGILLQEPLKMDMKKYKFDEKEIRVYKEKIQEFASFFNKRFKTFAFSNNSISSIENNNEILECFMENGIKYNKNESSVKLTNTTNNNIKILLGRRCIGVGLICIFTFSYILIFIQNYCCNFSFYIQKRNKYLICILASMAFIFINDQEIRKLKQVFVESQIKCEIILDHKSINGSLQNISNFLQILIAECQLMIYLLIGLIIMILLRGILEFYRTYSFKKEITNNTKTFTVKIKKQTSKLPYRSYSIAYPIHNNPSVKENYIETPLPDIRRSMCGIAQITNVFGYNVWITNSGKKYHRENCQYLKNNTYSFPKKLSELVGFTPCIKCKP